MITKKHVLAALAATSAALALSAPAQAQVAGIATASPTRVVASSKAFAAAQQQISTTYKAAFDQINQRRQAVANELKPLTAQLDTNKDGNVSDAEVQAAANAKNPAIDKIRTAQQNAQNDIQRLGNPAARAELFAIEGVLRQYDAAQLRVINARKINVVLSPEAFMYAPDSADISQAITAEIDKVAPTVGIQPPADWQPSRDTLAIQQQLAQLAQLRAYQQAAQQQQGQQQPAAAPAQQQPAKPAEPR